MEDDKQRSLLLKTGLFSWDGGEGGVLNQRLNNFFIDTVHFFYHLWGDDFFLSSLLVKCNEIYLVMLSHSYKSEGV